MCNINKKDKSFQLVGDNTFNDILCPDNVMFSDLETMSWNEIEENTFVIFYCCIYYGIMYACLLELVLTIILHQLFTCVNSYLVFFIVIF